jgi:hypothetical protein
MELLLMDVRITPLDVINPNQLIMDNFSVQDEMERVWESDWATL